MATLKDIARETGLQVETVSRVLNNRGYISEATRERVLEAVQRLHYRPNELARSLSMRHSNTLGLILPHIEHPYFAALLSAIEEVACERGQRLLIFSTKDKEPKAREYLETCLSNRVRGILMLSTALRADALRTLDVPLVTIECEQEGAAASVMCDNREGGLMAARHLIKRGCRHLAHLSGVRQRPMPANERSDGFVAACEEAGVTHAELITGEDAFNAMEYHDDIKRLLNENPDTDGIFAGSDLIAAQVLQVCASRGIDVPGQMRVVGFDNVPVAMLTTPQITTVAQPLWDMARCAVNCLLDGVKPGEERQVLPVKLVQRGTT